MNIYDKIEEIRQKPEYIRKRYVWFCVIVSMVIVLGIWTLSLKSRQYQAQTASQVAGQAVIFNELKEQKEALKEYKQQMTDIKTDLEKNLEQTQGQGAFENEEGFSVENGDFTNSSNNKPNINSADLFQ
jgi:hypothetical protein